MYGKILKGQNFGEFDEVNGMENFGESTGKSSIFYCTYRYWQEKIW